MCEIYYHYLVPTGSRVEIGLAVKFLTNLNSTLYIRAFSYSSFYHPDMTEILLIRDLSERNIFLSLLTEKLDQTL